MPTKESETVAHKDVLANIVVVLAEPRDPINVGTSVRAMKNMGLTRLRLVNPMHRFEPERIEIAAPRGGDIIERIEIFDDLPAALDDALLVVAMTARQRKDKKRSRRPREVVADIVAKAVHGPVVLLFGREDRGLTNEELDLAHLLVTIPTRPDYSSLNLGQAVLLMSYEIFEAEGTSTPLRSAKRDFDLATHGELEGMYGQVNDLLGKIGFYKSTAGRGVFRALREVAQRAELDTREVRIFRGIASEVVTFLQRKGVALPSEGQSGGPDATLSS